MKQIATIHELRLKDMESRAMEIQALHARIGIQKRVLECLVEMLTGVLPEDAREQLSDFLISDTVAEDIARIKNLNDFTMDQHSAMLADFRAAIERMPDE